MIKEQEMLEKELKENFEKDIDTIRNHITSLRLIGVGLSNTLNEKDEEIERLNNIINEFDKWLDVNLFNLEKEEASNIYNEGLKQGMLSNGRLIKSKLQELKGGDKE